MNDMKYNENVLSKTRQALFKSGVHYASTDESLYKTLKIIYLIFFVWAFFINLTHIASYILKIDGNGGHYIIEDSILADMKNSIIFTVIFTLCLLATYIFAVMLKHIASVSLGVVSCVLMIFHFKNIYADSLLTNGIKSSFYTRHLIPLIALLALAVWMGYIGIKQNVIEKRAYTKFVDGLYEQYKQRQARLSEDINGQTAFVSLSDEEWKNYINEFADSEQKEYKQKRSLKHKKRKESKQQENE